MNRTKLTFLLVVAVGIVSAYAAPTIYGNLIQLDRQPTGSLPTPSATNVGSLIYDTTLGVPVFSDGGSWISWGTGSGGGSSFDGGPLTVSLLTVTSDAGFSGNVGIRGHLDAGTVNITGELSLASDAGTAGQCLISNGPAVVPAWGSCSAGAITGTGTANNMAYWTGTSTLGNNNNLRVDPTNGRIGIGLTSAPLYPLHLGSTTANAKFILYDDGSGNRVGMGKVSGQTRFFNESSGNGWTFGILEAFATPVLTISGSGIISTTQSGTHSLGGTAPISFNTSNGAITTAATTNTTALDLNTSLANTKIQFGNNLGIGTASGQFRFHVNAPGTDFLFGDSPGFASPIFRVNTSTPAAAVTGLFSASGVTTLSAAVNYASVSLNTGTTLGTTHRYVRGDASGAAFTITLPAVGGLIGRVYSIKKTDASGNAVTIDANASETIDGALTFPLTLQYQSVTIVSNGSSWDIFD